MTEGYLDARFLRVLWRQLGKEDSLSVHDAGGAVPFWKAAVKYNQAGHHGLYIGLADLEQAPCATAVLERLNPPLSAGFHLRIAVRMLESWLLADRATLAEFLGVGMRFLPHEPDLEAHPKRTLLAAAAQSRKRNIRTTLLPQGSGALVGAEYVPVIAGFIENHWSAARARVLSPSLDRACQRWASI